RCCGLSLAFGSSPLAGALSSGFGAGLGASAGGCAELKPTPATATARPRSPPPAATTQRGARRRGGEDVLSNMVTLRYRSEEEPRTPVAPTGAARGPDRFTRNSA